MAEPSPGVYFVEVFGWLSYDSVEQVLINIKDMVDWRFYDNVTWLDDSLDNARRPWVSTCQRLTSDRSVWRGGY